MSMSNDLFVFFYHNILDKTILIFPACWTFAKMVEREEVNFRIRA